MTAQYLAAAEAALAAGHYQIARSLIELHDCILEGVVWAAMTVA